MSTLIVLYLGLYALKTVNCGIETHISDSVPFLFPSDDDDDDSSQTTYYSCYGDSPAFLQLYIVYLGEFPAHTTHFFFVFSFCVLVLSAKKTEVVKVREDCKKNSTDAWIFDRRAN